MAGIRRKSSKNQGGYLLIHLAEIFVSAGLVVGVAMQGNMVLASYQFSAAYNDLRHIENEVWAFYDRNEYWPKECNLLLQQEKINKQTADSCHVQSEVLIQDIQTLFAEKADAKEWSRQFSIQSVMSDAGNLKHAIILQQVDAQMAMWLDKKIDGRESLDSGRIRQLSANENELVYLFESDIH